MNVAGPYWQEDPRALRQASRLIAMRSRWSQRLPPAGARRL
jgi:hypothetical protein